MKKSTAWLSSLIILIAFLSTLLLIHYLKSAQAITNINLNNKQIADSFMTHIKHYRYNAKGLIESVLSAKTTTHYPYQDKTTFSKPQLTFYNQGDISWNISSHYGNSFNGIHKLLLQQQVKAKQPATSSRTETSINTNTITIFPDKSLAQTPEEVMIMQANGITQGKGMKINLKTHLLTFSSNSRGTYYVQNPH